jgi:hypothetical protein
LAAFSLLLQGGGAPSAAIRMPIDLISAFLPRQVVIKGQA